MHRLFSGTAVLVAAMLYAVQAHAADNEQIQQAVSRGVLHLRSQQAEDGTWPSHHVGATALVGLTLLECDVPTTDPAVQRAASYLRKVWTSIDDLHTTYALSLTILFFDRLGDPADTPIIQALAIRLLGGQNSAGGWSYQCPPLGPEDIRQLRTMLEQRVELRTKSELPRPAPRNSGSKPALPREIQQMIARLEQRGPAPSGRLDAIMGGGGDNSNTQFAILGLWAAHRHGVPVDKALARTAARFRGSQHADGGWGYMPTMGHMPRFGSATPSMTCAGLLGLALGYGSAQEARLHTEPLPNRPSRVSGRGEGAATRAASKKAPPDPMKDPVIRAGFAALARVIGQPLDEAGPAAAGLGDVYYLLWSVERVAVAYSLPTIADKDWYAWGSGFLLSAQRADGGWRGKYGSDVDTSFALLFLRRVNLSRDLTAYLKGRESIEVTLKAGDRLGEAGVQPKNDEAAKAQNQKEANGGRDKPLVVRGSPDPARTRDQVTKASPSPSVPAAKNAKAEAARLSAELLKASGQPQNQLLEQLKQAKGVAYTEALAAAIPQLSGPVKTKAREALAERLARMTAATLRDKLQDDAPEIRRAAALACAVKADKEFIPDLVTLLEDQQPAVARAAHAALKDLTGQDHGPAADAPPAARNRAAAAWKEWWKKQGGK